MNNIYFMCENCGIETNGITFVNGMKFCAKCYHQIFGKDNQQTEITQLKQQLAEKDKEIAHLKEKDNYHLRYELAGADETITNLKQQLEEKDKEIEQYKSNQKVISLHSAEDWYNRFIYTTTQNIKLELNQKQLAIQELEKVKELLITESKRYPIVYDINDDLVGGAIDKDKTFEIIDNQIKELKKG